MSAKNHDVIIIGAGIAGLTAAHFIAEFSQADVLVLEAKDDVGGRVKTHFNHPNIPLELGAALLQNPGTWEQPNPIIPLLRHADLAHLPVDPQHFQGLGPDGKSKPLSKILLAAHDHYQAAYLNIQNSKQKSGDVLPTLDTFLSLGPTPLRPGTPAFLAKQTLTAMIDQHTGNSPQNVSLLELLNDSDPSPEEHFIFGGYQALPHLLARKAVETEKVFIQLNTPVEKIHHPPKETEVKVVDCRETTYKAKIVICTVPLGVLQSTYLQFFPPLSSEKQLALQHLNKGFQNKVILEFERPFWPTDAHYVFPGSNRLHEWPEYFNLLHFSGGKTATLVAHFYAEAAQFGDQHDNDIIERALEPLRQAYGHKVTPLQMALVTRWDTDPYALGTTSCFGPKFQKHEISQLSKPEPGGLYFAGSHTLAKHRESVHGAYLSGLRVAIAACCDPRLQMKHKVRATTRRKKFKQ